MKTQYELKQRYTKLNKMDSNSMSLRVTLNKFGYKFHLKYSDTTRKGCYTSAINIWGKDADGYYDEDDIIAELKSEVCRLIDEQRKVIVDELKKAGVYEPADL